MTNKYLKSMRDFVLLIHKLLRSDRDVSIVISGMTGEGKSTLLIDLLKDYCLINKVKWDFNNLTWDREEIKNWIDGKKDKNGVITGQKKEYDVIGIDELYHLFNRRTWYDEGQMNSIQMLNMCRNRHLLIGGCVPNFWELDPAFTSRIRYHIYIPCRTIAWVFEQENSPACKDKWNYTLTKKLYRKYGNPYLCPNFVMEFNYNDLTDKEKDIYLSIRNKKRLIIHSKNNDIKEKYSNIKNQRNKLIKLLYGLNQDIIKDKKISLALGIEKFTYQDLSEAIGISKSAIKMIMIGER